MTEQEDLDSETEDEPESETDDESKSAFEAEKNIVLIETEKLDFNRLSLSKTLSEKRDFQAAENEETNKIKIFEIIEAGVGLVWSFGAFVVTSTQNY